MSTKEKENEVKDVEGLIGDLEVKIEELKVAPEVGDLVSQSIDHLLGNPDAEGEGSGSAAFGGGGKVDTGPVNDLTSMVRKKPAKKVQPTLVGNGAAAASGAAGSSTEVKRKAEETDGAPAKKAKAE
jgi:HAT1-interacting factor 1